MLFVDAVQVFVASEVQGTIRNSDGGHQDSVQLIGGQHSKLFAGGNNCCLSFFTVEVDAALHFDGRCTKFSSESFAPVFFPRQSIKTGRDTVVIDEIEFLLNRQMLKDL